MRLQDKWVETSGSVCLQRCQCPPDKGACTLDAACSVGSFACKQGFERVAGEQRCYLKGCQEGSLQVRACKIRPDILNDSPTRNS